jgi:hypothetical protein
LNKDFRILTEIGNLLYKEKDKPNKIENDFKNNLFPLSLFARKGGLLNQKTYDYLNSVSPKNLSTFKGSSTTNNQKTILQPLAKGEKGEQFEKETSIRTRNDVIYQYLKTFSLYHNRKNGILIQYNQHIGYNFNSKNILLRGVEQKTNKSLKNNKNTAAANAALNSNNSVLELNRLKGVSGLTGYNRSGNNRLIKYSYKLLFYFFKSMYCLISKPTFLFTPDKVIIQLFYFINIPKFKVFKWYSILNNKLIRQKWYSLKTNLKNRNKESSSKSSSKVKLSWRIKKTLFRLNKKRSKVKNTLFNLYKFNLFKVFSLKFKLICDILSNKFKKPVELRLIRIHQPFHDSNILVNLLSLNIKNKKFKTNVAIEKLYAKKAVKNLYDYSIKSVNFIPTFLSGIKIRIGGRLMREPIIPRITTKNFERGASSPGKVNFLDTATITKKNRKGSYTIKISSGQNFF